MSVLLTIVHIVVCFVLILVILLAGGRGQGLTGPSFASGNVQSLFGTQAGDFLTKATTVSAICFLFTSVGLGYVESHRSKSLLRFNQHSSQMDLDAIKKALERVKSEEKKAGTSVQKGKNQVKATATQAASETQSTSTQVVASAQKVAESVKETVAKTQAPSLPKKS